MAKYSPLRMRLLSMGCMFGLAVSLTACSSDPKLYTLAPVSGVVQSGGPVVVEVRTPVVPSRLDRDTIVRQNRDYQTTLATGDSWSEALPDMIAQTLTTDLSQRLPGTTVVSQGDAVTTTPSAYVEVTIRNFEADAAGHALITGAVSVHPAQKMIGPVLTEAFAWQSPESAQLNTGKLVASLSQGLSVLADHAASRLRSLPSTSR
ncbi:PqiC family protein [Gluconobacter cerinus]|uniref:PqiC family protein n=1 Tax=Gluconobacter cerinus TaxID=38307 RepID=UPI001B8CAA4A|nr:PqiC family protein [Gluconobacter cerinus]MBS1035421.1 membrane integrity-associated transporter subunit PqiC [Gluconobacter cerinus]